MAPELIILAILQSIRLGTALLERYNRGELTDAEFEAEWKQMQADLAAANQAWEQAGQQPTEPT